MGSGYRTFTAGEVLTASNVQNYLQDQAVMVFGGTAARSSAIGTANFEEGMLTYLTDVDKLQVYTGATFADVYPAAASTQGLTLINTTSFSAVAGFSLAANSFTTTYDNYRLTIKYTPSTDITPMRLRLRASGSDLTAASYGDNPFTTSATTAVAQGVSQTSARVVNLSTTDEAIIDLDIYTPASASLKTHWVGSSQRGGTSGDRFFGAYTVATSADSLTIYPNTGTITGSYSLYGYNK
jgi:hypothetical protein